jgi:hypothetical protein
MVNLHSDEYVASVVGVSDEVNSHRLLCALLRLMLAVALRAEAEGGVALLLLYATRMDQTGAPALLSLHQLSRLQFGAVLCVPELVPLLRTTLSRMLMTLNKAPTRMRWQDMETAVGQQLREAVVEHRAHLSRSVITCKVKMELSGMLSM